LNPTILHTVLLALTTLIVSISGRTLLDMALSHFSGPATIARWAQLSSLIDLTSAVACAGLSPGVTVLVARASNLDVQSMILRTSVMLGLACSALTLAGMIGVATMVDFAGFQNVGAHIQVLNDPTLRWTVFLVGIFAATPVLAMQAWQSQGNPKRSCWLTLAGSTMTVTAAVMSPYLLDATGLRIGTLAPLMVLLAAMTISVPLTVWYSSQSWRPMMHNSGQFKALLTFLPAGLSIGLLSPLSLIAARELMGVALGWDAVASVQAIWRCADWVAAFVSGMLSLVFLPRMSRAISACKSERESELGLKRGSAHALWREIGAAIRWLWIPAAVILGAMIWAGPQWLVGLFGLSVVPEPAVFSTFLVGEWLRMGSWILLYGLFATGSQRVIAVGELCSLPLFAGLLWFVWLLRAKLSLQDAAWAYFIAYVGYLVFNCWAIRRALYNQPDEFTP
jgi:O-antigen/teichoic acid export membrane protein